MSNPLALRPGNNLLSEVLGPKNRGASYVQKVILFIDRVGIKKITTILPFGRQNSQPFQFFIEST